VALQHGDRTNRAPEEYRIPTILYVLMDSEVTPVPLQPLFPVLPGGYCRHEDPADVPADEGSRKDRHMVIAV